MPINTVISSMAAISDFYIDLYRKVAFFKAHRTMYTLAKYNETNANPTGNVMYT